MPSIETLLILLLAAAAGCAILVLAAVLHRPRPGTAARALERGDFAAALEQGAAAESPGERLAAAVAARHLLAFDRAARLLDDLLAAAPGDGEAWLERGLVAAHTGDVATAEAAWERVEQSRSDLLEPLTLHRAWLALRSGDRHRALQLFEEVEAPLENKLRTDLGSGDPAFADWFLQASALWRAAGETGKADWAVAEARKSAPASRLITALP